MSATFIFTSILIVVGVLYIFPQFFIISLMGYANKRTVPFAIVGSVFSIGAELYMFWLIAQRIMRFL